MTFIYKIFMLLAGRPSSSRHHDNASIRFAAKNTCFIATPIKVIDKKKRFCFSLKIISTYIIADFDFNLL